MKNKINFGIYQLMYMMYIAKGLILLTIAIILGSIVIGFWNCGHVWSLPCCDFYHNFIVGLESSLKLLGLVVSFIIGFLGIAFIIYPFIKIFEN